MWYMQEKNDDIQTVKNKKPSFVAALGIGCLVILVFSVLAFGIAFAVVGKMIFSPFSENFLKSTIEKTTGIKIDNGKNRDTLSFHNEKTGESVDLVEGKIPSNFPKDFPLYPGAVPGGTAVGSEQAAGKGFWLLLESNDAVSDVTAYYDQQLEGKGWIVEEKNTMGDGSVYNVKKEKLIGNLIISSDKKSEKTTILITLEPTNEQNPEPQEVAPEGAEPLDEPQ